MIKFVIKRILLCIPILLGVSVIVFLILKATPGDPARVKLGQYASEEALTEQRELWGLNDSIPVQYFNWCRNLLRGSLGESYIKGTEVAKDLMIRSRVSMPLVLIGLLLSALIGIPLGVIAAVRQYRPIDYLSQVLALLMQAVPPFLMAMLLMLLFSLRLGWFPSVGADTPRHYVLPIVAVAIAGVAGIIRLTRSSMLEALRADYVRTVRAKGARKSTVVLSHCLPNALMTVLTSIGSSVGISISSTVVVESVFALDGIGTYLRDAILGKDVPAVMGSVMFIAVVTCLANLIVDVSYGLIDPRIKAQYIGK